jgi:hypothetical protein
LEGRLRSLEEAQKSNLKQVYSICGSLIVELTRVR